MGQTIIYNEGAPEEVKIVNPGKQRADSTLREGARRLRAAPVPDAGLNGALAEIGLEQSTVTVRAIRRAVRRRKLQRSAACVGAVLTLGLFTARYAYLRYGDVNPQVNIPAHVMPEVNAYHTWEKAWRVAVDLEGAGEAVGRSHRAGYVETDAERRQRTRILARNQETFRLIRQGLTQPYVPRRVEAIDQLLPDLSHLRSLARLMSLSSENLLLQGKPDEALAVSLETVAMGEMSFRATSTIGRLVGIAVEAIGRSTSWHIVSKVDATAARAAALRLAEIDARRMPLSSILREEMYGLQLSLLNIFKSPSWREARLNDFEIKGLVMFATKRGLMAELTRAMEVQISKADLLPPDLTEVESTSIDPLINTLVFPADALIFKNVSNAVTQSRLLSVEFALRSHRVEHGAYPAALGDLVPSYLPKLPRDPFRPKQTFGYVRTKEGHKLYSVGPDGLDQGGKSIVRPNETTEGSRRMVLRDSKGDIVAGVNKW